jgi:hypothetical protein
LLPRVANCRNTDLIEAVTKPGALSPGFRVPEP